MDRRFLLALFLFAAVATAATDDTNTDDLLIRQVVDNAEDHLLNAEHHFSSFKSKFSKTYATQEEHDYRFGVFKSNLIKAKLHQKLDPSAEHGITKFSDLTASEFRQFLGLKKGKGLRLPAHAQKAPILPTNNLPEDFDWREKGAVTPVKNQACTTPKL
jgi:cathepsin F